MTGSTPVHVSAGVPVVLGSGRSHTLILRPEAAFPDPSRKLEFWVRFWYLNPLTGKWSFGPEGVTAWIFVGEPGTVCGDKAKTGTRGVSTHLIGPRPAEPADVGFALSFGANKAIDPKTGQLVAMEEAKLLVPVPEEWSSSHAFFKQDQKTRAYFPRYDPPPNHVAGSEGYPLEVLLPSQVVFYTFGLPVRPEWVKVNGRHGIPLDPARPERGFLAVLHGPRDGSNRFTWRVWPWHPVTGDPASYKYDRRRRKLLTMEEGDPHAPYLYLEKEADDSRGPSVEDFVEGTPEDPILLDITRYVEGNECYAAWADLDGELLPDAVQTKLGPAEWMRLYLFETSEGDPVGAQVLDSEALVSATRERTSRQSGFRGYDPGGLAGEMRWAKRLAYLPSWNELPLSAVAKLFTEERRKAFAEVEKAEEIDGERYRQLSRQCAPFVLSWKAKPKEKGKILLPVPFVHQGPLYVDWDLDTDAKGPELGPPEGLYVTLVRPWPPTPEGEPIRDWHCRFGRSGPSGCLYGFADWEPDKDDFKPVQPLLVELPGIPLEPREGELYPPRDFPDPLQQRWRWAVSTEKWITDYARIWSEGQPLLLRGARKPGVPAPENLLREPRTERVRVLSQKEHEYWKKNIDLYKYRHEPACWVELLIPVSVSVSLDWRGEAKGKRRHPCGMDVRLRRKSRGEEHRCVVGEGGALFELDERGKRSPFELAVPRTGKLEDDWEVSLTTGAPVPAAARRWEVLQVLPAEGRGASWGASIPEIRYREEGSTEITIVPEVGADAGDRELSEKTWQAFRHSVHARSDSERRWLWSRLTERAEKLPGLDRGRTWIGSPYPGPEVLIRLAERTDPPPAGWCVYFVASEEIRDERDAVLAAEGEVRRASTGYRWRVPVDLKTTMGFCLLSDAQKFDRPPKADWGGFKPPFNLPGADKRPFPWKGAFGREGLSDDEVRKLVEPVDVGPQEVWKVDEPWPQDPDAPLFVTVGVAPSGFACPYTWPGSAPTGPARLRLYEELPDLRDPEATARAPFVEFELTEAKELSNGGMEAKVRQVRREGEDKDRLLLRPDRVYRAVYVEWLEAREGAGQGRYPRVLCFDAYLSGYYADQMFIKSQDVVQDPVADALALKPGLYEARDELIEKRKKYAPASMLVQWIKTALAFVEAEARSEGRDHSYTLRQLQKQVDMHRTPYGGHERQREPLFPKLDEPKKMEWNFYAKHLGKYLRPADPGSKQTFLDHWQEEEHTVLGRLEGQVKERAEAVTKRLDTLELRQQLEAYELLEIGAPVEESKSFRLGVTQVVEELLHQLVPTGPGFKWLQTDLTKAATKDKKEDSFYHRYVVKPNEILKTAHEAVQILGESYFPVLSFKYPLEKLKEDFITGLKQEGLLPEEIDFKSGGGKLGELKKVYKMYDAIFHGKGKPSHLDEKNKAEWERMDRDLRTLQYGLDLSKTFLEGVGALEKLTAGRTTPALTTEWTAVRTMERGRHVRGEFVRKQSTKVVGRATPLAVAVAVIDIAQNAIEIHQAIEKGDDALVVAGALSIASNVLFIAGAATMSVPPLGVALLVAGAALKVASEIAKLFKDKPLESWLKNSYFGTNFHGGPWKGREDDRAFEEQVRALWKIICKPKIVAWYPASRGGDGHVEVDFPLCFEGSQVSLEVRMDGLREGEEPEYGGLLLKENVLTGRPLEPDGLGWCVLSGNEFKNEWTGRAQLSGGYVTKLQVWPTLKWKMNFYKIDRSVEELDPGTGKVSPRKTFVRSAVVDVHEVKIKVGILLNPAESKEDPALGVGGQAEWPD